MRRLLPALALVVLAPALAAADEHAPGPRIRVEPGTFDFGRTLPNRTLTKEFSVRNFGDRDLVVDGVSTSCGCTAALLASKTIKPGGSTPLRVTLETRSYAGKVEREVLVRSNDTATPVLTIRLTATVAAK